MQENRKPFNLEAAKSGKPVITRDGREARIICFDKKGDYPIVVLVPNHNQADSIITVNNDGLYGGQGLEKDYDLFMKPEKKTYYVNIYDNDLSLISSHVLSSLTSVEENKKSYSHIQFKQTISFEVEE